MTKVQIDAAIKVLQETIPDDWIYFNNNGTIVSFGDASFPIDPSTRRTKGVTIEIKWPNSISYQISRIGYTGRGTAVSNNGIVIITNPFSAATYTLILNNKQTYTFTISNGNVTPVPTNFIKGLMGSMSWSGAGPMYQDVGANGAIRVWNGTGKNYDATISDKDCQYLKDQQTKYDTQYILLFTPPETKTGDPLQGRNPTYSESREFFQRNLAQIRKYGIKILAWEIGNEPDMKNRYWYGSLTDYVQLFLKPAYEVLANAGEKVVGGGTVYETSFTDIIDLGYLNYCHYPNHHPYDGNAKGQIARMQRIVDKHPEVKGKLVITEWNFHFGDYTKASDLKAFDLAWCKDLTTSFNYMKTICYILCYFEYKIYNSPGGHGGLLNTDYSKHQPFYDNFKAMK